MTSEKFAEEIDRITKGIGTAPTPGNLEKRRNEFAAARLQHEDYLAQQRIILEDSYARKRLRGQVYATWALVFFTAVLAIVAGIQVYVIINQGS